MPFLSAMSELPKPDNVTLSSSHFIHQLTWEPGPGSPGDVHYNVLVHSGRCVSVCAFEFIRVAMATENLEKFRNLKGVFCKSHGW